jgi:hypothetical protein
MPADQRHLRSADPGRVRLAVENLATHRPELEARLEHDPRLADA